MAAFNQPGSTTCPLLDSALQHAATLIWYRDPTATVYLGGSYVSNQRDPSDLDLPVRSDIWNDATFYAGFFATYRTEEPLIDACFNRTQDTQHQDTQHMENHFHRIEGLPAPRKRIAGLRP
jgi:hypothetical protein